MVIVFYLFLLGLPSTGRCLSCETDVEDVDYWQIGKIFNSAMSQQFLSKYFKPKEESKTTSTTNGRENKKIARGAHAAEGSKASPVEVTLFTCLAALFGRHRCFLCAA